MEIDIITPKALAPTWAGYFKALIRGLKPGHLTAVELNVNGIGYVQLVYPTTPEVEVPVLLPSRPSNPLIVRVRTYDFHERASGESYRVLRLGALKGWGSCETMCYPYYLMAQSAKGVDENRARTYAEAYENCMKRCSETRDPLEGHTAGFDTIVQRRVKTTTAETPAGKATAGKSKTGKEEEWRAAAKGIAKTIKDYWGDRRAAEKVEKGVVANNSVLKYTRGYKPSAPPQMGPLFADAMDEVKKMVSEVGVRDPSDILEEAEGDYKRIVVFPDGTGGEVKVSPEEWEQYAPALKEYAKNVYDRLVSLLKAIQKATGKEREGLIYQYNKLFDEALAYIKAQRRAMAWAITMTKKDDPVKQKVDKFINCLLYTSPSPRDRG